VAPIAGDTVSGICISTEVEVEVQPEDLEDAGWHHEDDCPGKPGAPLHDWLAPDYGEVIRALHEQAHGKGDLFKCRKHPCSMLTFEQLRAVA
jgi:hypothetical protein